MQLCRVVGVSLRSQRSYAPQVADWYSVMVMIINILSKSLVSRVHIDRPLSASGSADQSELSTHSDLDLLTDI